MFRKRWVRRVLVGLLVSLVLFVAGVFVIRYLDRRAGEQKYAAAVSHLDATDPRWRYDEIVADQGHLPDDQNGARLVPPFKAALAYKDNPRSGEDKEPLLLPYDYLIDVSPNRALTDETYKDLEEVLAANAEALEVALRFADRPHGRRHYTLALNPIDTRLPEVQDTRLVARLLDQAAERAGRDGRGAVALGYVRPMLNVGRSLETEPFMISTLVRMACLKTAVTRVERTLGLATPRGGLADVQALFVREADADLFWYGLRGDRAVMDALFTRLRDGSLTISGLAGTGANAGGPESRFVTWRYAPHLPADHATFLDITARAYEVRTLPEHQQRKALAGVEHEIKLLHPAEFGSLLTRLLTPAFSKIHDASVRTKAQLRCAAAGIAVERYRLAHGRWPAGLDEIPRDLLPAVPLDPFDGKPLRYAKRDDGVTVYAVGPDGQDDGGTIRSGKTTTDPGQDVGFRLYDPAHRGLPPEPPRTPVIFFPAPGQPDWPPDFVPTETGPEPREVEGAGGS